MPDFVQGAGGNTSVILELIINEPPTLFNYSSTSYVFTRDEPISDKVPTLSGGFAETWEVYPDLPNGLELIDGLISGTPLVNMTQTLFTIWANNSGGNTSTQLDIVINEPLTMFVYSSSEYIFTRTELIIPQSPVLSGGNAEEWGIYPQLPTGLSFAGGEISGTPQVNSTETMYQIWANNTGGSSTIFVNISINEPLTTIDYQSEQFVFTRASQITQISPILSGGNAVSWAIEPQVPSGLSFNQGVFSGTPQINMSATEYTTSLEQLKKA